MKNNLAKIFVILIPTVLITSSCSDFRKALGKEKIIPDEFSVALTPALVIPPGYKIDPEMIKSNKYQNTNQMNNLNQTLNIDDKKNYNSFIKLFESENIPKNIRKIVDEETIGIAVSEQNGLEKLFGDIPNVGIVLDNKNEAKRIKDNKLLGKPINKDASPAFEKNSGKLILIK
jgi:hypothetical protein